MKMTSLNHRERIAFSVSAIYIIVSLTYILLSDYLATSIFSDIETIRIISTIKGWAFVLLSGILIYLLIRRSQRISVDSEERFLLLADLTIEGIILHKNGIALDVNDAFTELLGYKRTDIIGKNLIDIFICEEYKQVCNENTKSQSTEPYEVMAKKKNGDEIWIQIIGKPFRFFGKNARVAAIRDITEQKKAEHDLQSLNYELRATEEELLSTNDALRENISSLEIAVKQAEESDRLKSAFLANMSHEIRTPMNAIVGFSELLDMEDMPYEKRKTFTKTIKERTKDLLLIINDILDISRIESYTLKTVETKGNINDILVEIKDFFEIRNAEIYSKPITFSLFNELTPNQYFIKADFDRIRQIIINLLDNAFKFTAKGSIHLCCKLKDQNTLMFCVSDSGIGISKGKQQLIFERFRQLDDSYLTREYGGVGLGLSICKGLIELMNGSIWVESEPEKGSVFFFTIPYISTNRIFTDQDIAKSVSYDFTKKTILIVEDVAYNQEYLREILNDTNATLIFADNGVSAIEEFRLHTAIDLVLMDIRLPDINGLELTKNMIKERNNIKIIAQTAYASSDDQSKCMEAGCIDFVSKPISKNLLLNMLNKYLK
jgi:PAS domain S-box-containing protein